ncbi:MAG TPA: selenocysteine-specific translation elongation factor [Solirubrobacteraceae bacterium]|nr:selenocysteine-specific translation elongation factor [Solirubrobacteraceae bacterium]
MTEPLPLTLGTAGHIDHGKTALVRALTGVNTDRLPQERARGISIELGYASLTLPGGRRLSVIDVPGHERFVRTMVAGATGIDLYLMVVAADDGVMPQTSEHAAVLRALGVDSGVVAVTKADRADPRPAMRAAQELLGDIETVAVSTPNGEGLDLLRAALARAAAAVSPRSRREGPARLHVDRVFTIRGAGTVVTGTLWSGTLHRGQRVCLLPGDRLARVRGLQVHDRPVDDAAGGQRVAVNLTGVGVDELARGDVIAEPQGAPALAYRLDCELELELDGEPDALTRVQVHHGTRETPARLTWLGGRFWQIRCERPLLALAGDRVVVRRIAPPDTLGGGQVLDPAPPRHGPARALTARLSAMARGDAPPAPPRPPESPRPSTGGPVELGPEAIALEERLRTAGIEPPPDSELDAEALGTLREAGGAVRVARGLHMHPSAVARAREQLVGAARAGGGQITLAQARDVLVTSRKFAQALLEHLDGERVFLRRGDAHVLRRAEGR